MLKMNQYRNESWELETLVVDLMTVGGWMMDVDCSIERYHNIPTRSYDHYYIHTCSTLDIQQTFFNNRDSGP